MEGELGASSEPHSTEQQEWKQTVEVEVNTERGQERRGRQESESQASKKNSPPLHIWKLALGRLCPHPFSSHSPPCWSKWHLWDPLKPFACHAFDHCSNPADQWVYTQTQASSSRKPKLKLGGFSLIKFTVYTNSITSPHMWMVAREARSLTHIHHQGAEN